LCATTPSPFFAVGQSYWTFRQTTDEELRDLLRAATAVRPHWWRPDLSDAAKIRSSLMPVAAGHHDYRDASPVARTGIVRADR